jgi:hypothetical protein
LFQEVTIVTLSSSLRSLRLRFWDEQRRQLVGYAHLRRFAAERWRVQP